MDKSIALILSALLLSACQGENTFKRESNPYKDYSAVTEDVRPYDPTNRPKPQPVNQVPFTSTPACTQPLVMSFEKDGVKIENDKNGKRVIEFIEGQEKTITVKVESHLDSERTWEVRPVVSPCADCFTKVSKTATQAVYKFKWKPEAGSAAKIQDQSLVLRYDFQMDVRCQSAPVNEVVGLIVKDSSPNALDIGFPGLRTEIKFGEETKFQIQITDAKDSSKLAEVKQIAFSFNKEGELVNGRTAVDCNKAARQIQTAEGKPAWVFDCVFESRMIDIKDADLKKLSGSGKTVTAAFSVKAEGKTADKSSELTTARVQILFEKITAAATDPKKVQGE